MRKLFNLLAAATTAFILTTTTLPAQQQFQTTDATVQVLVEDRSDGTGRTHYMLQTATEALTLEFVDGAPPLTTGQKVRVRGMRQGNILSVRKQDIETDVQPYPINLTPRVLVALVTLVDRPTPSASVEDATTVMGWARDGWWDFSSRKMQMAFQVVGPIAVNLTAAQVCPNGYATLHSTVDLAILEQYGLETYRYATHRLYLFPDAGCPWWGLGAVGGNLAWVQGSVQFFVVAHELGHNWGLSHSKSLSISDGVWSSYEYGGDDIMGSGRGHPNAFHKSLIDFILPADNSLQIVTQSGRYAIAPAATLSVPRGLKIAANGVDYYVETRNNDGYDWITTPGVRIHHAASGQGVFLRDRDPSAVEDFIVDPGQEFIEGDLRVRTLTADAAGAEVEITLGTVPPPPPPPDEVCNDGIDNDGDGLIDEDPPCTVSPPPPPPPPADTEAPSLSLNVKRSGKSTNVNISASATDNVGVVSGSVVLDGKVIAAFTSTVSLTIKVGNGTHTVTATVNDEAGNSTTRSVTF